jgi:hypothetical protein
MTSLAPRARRAFAAACALAFAGHAAAVPPTREEVVQWCAEADGMVHCARLIEAQQMKRLPGLAKREDNDLVIALFPSGTRRFSDVDRLVDPVSYAFYDTLDPINGVLLFKVEGDRTSYVLLQRAGNRVTELPSEPALAPNRQRLVTADFCAAGCANELVVWRVTRDGVFPDLVHRPAEAWTDAIPRWKDAETIVVDYAPPGDAPRRTVERSLSQPGWQKPR